MQTVIVMLITVQLASKLTLACDNMRVFFYFWQVTQSELTCDTRVNFRVEHASYIRALHEIHLLVLHDCKKHASNTCVLHMSQSSCMLHTC